MSDDKFIDFSNFKSELKKEKSKKDDFNEIKMLKKENESYKHFVMNIVNSISAYSQLIELCLNTDTNQTEEEINSKIKIYSTEIKNNSKHLINILQNTEIIEQENKNKK